MKLSKKTNKLFYDKFVYKVEAQTPLGTLYHERDLSKVRLKLNEYDTKVQAAGGELDLSARWYRRVVTTDDIFANIQFLTLLEAETDPFSIRVEGNTVGIYTNNKAFVDQLSYIKGFVRELTVPKSDKVRDYLLANPDKVVVKNYTHKYKVIVGGLGHEAENFVAWAENMPKIKLAGKKKYLYDSYFYVTDLKVLGMCRLFLSKKIRKVQELVTEQEI